MNTILVWVLVTINTGMQANIVYSPPMPDLGTCQHLQQNLPFPYREVDIKNTRCIQIKVVK